MPGQLVIDNRTGRPIPAFDCLSPFQVLLVSGGYRPVPSWLGCLQRFIIPVGESSYPVTVTASYNQCGRKGSPGTIVPCLAGGRPPPLPAGNYMAVLFQVSHLAEAPPPVPVRVTP